MTARRLRYLAPLAVLALAAIVATFLISSGGEKTNGPGAPQQPLVLAPPRAPATPLFTATAGATYPLQLRRDDGRQVLIAAQPRRILSLSAGATEILFQIGAGPQVVGVSSDSDYPPDAAALPKVAASAGVTAIQAFNPDLIVIVGAGAPTVTALDSAAVPVVALKEPVTVAELEQQIQFFGDVTGRLADAQRAAAALGRRVDAVKRQLAGVQQGPRVFVDLGPAGHGEPSGTLLSDMLMLLKAQNLQVPADPGQNGRGRAAAANPDAVLLAGATDLHAAADLATLPGWANVAAVRAGRVAAIDPALLRPGPRIADELLMLEQFLYPNLP
ncbi:MAG TPA: ABC transporter substrate-binding protein [Dehalococcoidia bacterium]|nr:ABC transporter substrate-binding protein [Dehalococcoidia bacterium]